MGTRITRRRSPLFCAAVVAVGITVGGVTTPALAAPDRPPVPAGGGFTPPEAVNRTPVGTIPDDAYSVTVRQTSPASTITTANPASTLVAADALGASGASPAAGDGLGVQPFYGLESFALTDRLSAQVNLSNGNLVVRSTDQAINGPGLSLNLDRFYNSRSTGAGTFGQRSVLSTGRDVGLTVSDSTVTFSGPSGFTATFTADGAGGYTAPAGVNADLVENGDGTFALTYRSSAEKLTFSAGGFLTSDADRNGNALTFGYNADNTLASITDTAGRVTELEYLDGRTSALVDPSGRRVKYFYDRSGNLTTVLDSADGVVRYRYNDAGQLIALQTPGLSWVGFGYDSTGRVTKVDRFLVRNRDRGDASTTTFSYGSGQTTQTNPLGHNTVYSFDGLGRVTKVTDPLNRARSATWTANSDIATAVDAMGTGGAAGNTTTFSYDSNNSRTAVQAPTGAAARAQYTNEDGCESSDTSHPYQAKCTSDAQSNKTGITYDAPGNVTSVTDTTATGGVSLSYAYQRPAGDTTGTDCGGKPGQQCSATDGKGAVTRFSYNSDGELTTVTPPAPLGATTYTYDSLSRVTSVTDGKGQTTSYAYDSLDKITEVAYSRGSGTLRYSYDADGRTTRQVDSSGNDLTYTYDALGREVARTVPGGAEQKLGYDKAGNLTSFTDGAGTVNYSYDAANQLTALAEPGTTCPPTGSPTGCTRFTYDANGARLTTTYPGGTVQRATVDNSGRVTRLQATTASGAVLSDLGYSYTATGTTGPDADRTLLQFRSNTVAVGAPNGSTTAFGYDSLSRLTRARETSGNGSVNADWAYTYDPAGNRTQETVTAPGGGVTTTTYAYNDADQLTTRNGTGGYSYDANGNQTAAPAVPATALSPVPTPANKHSHNGRDQVTTTTSGATTVPFAYEGGSNRNRISAGSTAFQFSGLGLTTSTTNGAATGFVRTPGGGLVAMRTTAGSVYYLTDHQGSVIGLVDDKGTRVASYAYNPFGETRAVTGVTSTDRATADSNPYRYTSGYLDSTSNLYAFRYRYYDPTQARFTQQDPSGQEANAYLYASGNPINASDPSGLESVSGSASICGFGVCLSASIGLDDDGDVSISGGIGVGGGAGFNGEYDPDGDYEEGYEGVTGSAGCNAGPVNFSVSQNSKSGDTGGNVTAGTGSGFGCSAQVSSGFTF